MPAEKTVRLCPVKLAIALGARINSRVGLATVRAVRYCGERLLR
jgi:hypothetical protein